MQPFWPCRETNTRMTARGFLATGLRATRRATALRRWAPEEAPHAGPSAVGVADETDSCADWCAHYDSELDGSCDGLGWSDDEELAAALAEQYA